MKYKIHNKYPNQIILIEKEYWYITLLDNQYYLGRSIIELKDITKRHISELNEKEILELFYLIKKYEISLKKSFNTTNFNWTSLMNNSYKENSDIDPLHIHVYPRYKEKVVFNKEIFKDEVFAHHYDKDKKKYVDIKFLITLADKILENWE